MTSTGPDAAVTSFRPTHTVPSDGMDTWSDPNPSRAPDNRLDPGVPVLVLEETTGWARVRCSNGWEAWVDVRRLVAVESASFSPTPVPPLATWLPVLGAALAVLGGFVPWFKDDGASLSAWDIELVSLFTREESDFDLKTGPVLLLVALVALPLLAGRPMPRWGAIGIAAVATNIGLLGVRLYLDFPDPRPDLGVGLILTLLGGVVMTVGALLTPGGARPRTVSA